MGAQCCQAGRIRLLAPQEGGETVLVLPNQFSAGNTLGLQQLVDQPFGGFC